MKNSDKKTLFTMLLMLLEGILNIGKKHVENIDKE